MDDLFVGLSDETLRILEVVILAFIAIIMSFFICLAINISGREPEKFNDEVKTLIREKKISIIFLSSLALLAIYVFYQAMKLDPVPDYSKETGALWFGLARADLIRMLEILILSSAALSYVFLVFPSVLKKGFQLLGVFVGTGDFNEPLSLKTPGIVLLPEKTRKWLLMLTLIAISSLLMPPITLQIFFLQKNSDNVSAETAPNSTTENNKTNEPQALFYGLNKNDLLRVAEYTVLILIQVLVIFLVIQPGMLAFVAEVSPVQFVRWESWLMSIAIILGSSAVFLHISADGIMPVIEKIGHPPQPEPEIKPMLS